MIPTEVKRIIEVIERDRKKKVNKIRREGKQNANKILEDARRECVSLRMKILEDYRKRSDFLRKKGFANIEIKRRETLKKIKAELARELKEESMKRVREYNYEKLLNNFLWRGIKELGGKRVEIFVNRHDMNFAKKFLKGKEFEGKVKAINTAGGCMIKSGRLTANYLMESLAERKEREIEKNINEIFFKG